MHERINLAQTVSAPETACRGANAVPAPAGEKKAHRVRWAENASTEELVVLANGLRSQLEDAEWERMAAETRGERLPRSRAREIGRMEEDWELAWREIASRKEPDSLFRHLAKDRFSDGWLDTSQLHVEDLRQEGLAYAAFCAPGFDASRGNRFTTYVRWGAEGKMNEYMSENAHAAKVTQYAYNRYKSVREELGSDAAPVDFAGRSSVAGDAASVVGRAKSLDDPVSGEDGEAGAVMGDLLVSEASIAEDPQDALVGAETCEVVLAAFEDLDDRHRLVAGSLFGLGGVEPAKPERLAERLGVSVQRVSQMKGEARAAIRDALANREGPLAA